MTNHSSRSRKTWKVDSSNWISPKNWIQIHSSLLKSLQIWWIDCEKQKQWRNLLASGFEKRRELETTPFASEFTATEVAHKHPRSRPGFATKCNEIHLVLVQSLLLYFRRTRLSNFTDTDSSINSFCFYFTKIMNWTNTTWSSSVSIRFLQQPTKENMHWNNNNNNGHTKKQQHWNNKKSRQVWWSRIRHIIRMKSLDTCVCVRARACIYQMHERNATKKEENRWKKSTGAICEEEEEERNIWERDIWARDTLHYPYPWEKEHTGSLMAWTDVIQELARSCEILVLAVASNIPGRKKDGVLGMSGDDDHEENNKEPRRAWAMR